MDVLEWRNNYPWLPSRSLAHIQTTHSFEDLKGNYWVEDAAAIVDDLTAANMVYFLIEIVLLMTVA